MKKEKYIFVRKGITPTVEKEVTEKYTIEQAIPFTSPHEQYRRAEIFIVDKVFDKCDFVGLKTFYSAYSVDDWEFIYEVAKRVMELTGRIK